MLTSNLKLFGAGLTVSEGVLHGRVPLSPQPRLLLTELSQEGHHSLHTVMKTLHTVLLL